MNDVLNLAAYIASGALSLTLLAALCAAPLAVLTLLIDLIVGRWLSAQMRCWLWTLVAVRLVLPVAPESPFSSVHLWQLVAWSESKATSVDAPSELMNFLSQQAAHPIDATPAAQASARTSMADILREGRDNLLPDLAVTSAEWERLWRSGSVGGEDPAATGLHSATQEWNWQDTLVAGVVMAWGMGAVVVLLRAAIASVRFARNLKKTPEVDEEAVIGEVLRACGEVGVRRPAVKAISGLPAPALFGVWRPTLCLPASPRQELTGRQLRLVVLHEAMHLRRRDGYLASLLTLVRAIHWFNPLAWYAIKQVESFRELACDEAVKRLAQPEERAAYADLLLHYALGRRSAALGLLGLWFARLAGKKELAKRIKALAAGDRRPGGVSQVAACSLLLLMVAVGLTDAASTSDVAEGRRPELPVFSASEPSAWDVLVTRAISPKQPVIADAIETREYDLAEALRRVDDVPDNFNAVDWLLLWAKPLGHSQDSPMITPVEGQPHRFLITMPAQRHQFFASMLAEVQRMGHVGQVVVSTRVLSSDVVEKLVDADWMGTIKFAAPEPVSSSQWADAVAKQGDGEFSLSMEAVSYEYAPYTAFVIDSARMSKLVDYFQANARTSIHSAPRVTLFSGQSAVLSDETRSPFVYGVEPVVGEYATAWQPNITVIPEGLKVDLQALAMDGDVVDLRCRLALSSIDGVAEAKLPGGEVTVQTPRGTRRTVNVRCRLHRGETLLVAPIAGQRSDGVDTHYYAISAEQILEERVVAD
ncbi:MAG: hypothetical protein KDA61_15780 [Planctomycetales bacterium]|nr:hypothetical protein [Planctomycetales bacterium]